MWVLRCLDADDQSIYRLVALRNYAVGRTDCDIRVMHKSVSRHHADLSVGVEGGKQNLMVKDLSKFGTFLNGVRLKNGVEVEVSHGSELQFGLASGRFSVTYEPMRVCVSGVGKNRKPMDDLVHRAGCELVQEVDECTHLVISALTLTLKAVNALLLQKIIVSPQWLDELVMRTDVKSDIPKPELYPPELGEKIFRGASLAPDARRAAVFAGCLFFFLSDSQYAKAASLVIGAGGRPEKFTVARAKELIPSYSIYIVRLGEKEKDDPEAQNLAHAAQPFGQVINETSLGLAILRVTTTALVDLKKKTVASPPPAAAKAVEAAAEKRIDNREKKSKGKDSAAQDGKKTEADKKTKSADTAEVAADSAAHAEVTVVRTVTPPSQLTPPSPSLAVKSGPAPKMRSLPLKGLRKPSDATLPSAEKTEQPAPVAPAAAPQGASAVKAEAEPAAQNKSNNVILAPATPPPSSPPLLVASSSAAPLSGQSDAQKPAAAATSMTGKRARASTPPPAAKLNSAAKANSTKSGTIGKRNRSPSPPPAASSKPAAAPATLTAKQPPQGSLSDDIEEVSVPVKSRRIIVDSNPVTPPKTGTTATASASTPSAAPPSVQSAAKTPMSVVSTSSKPSTVHSPFSPPPAFDSTPIVRPLDSAAALPNAKHFSKRKVSDVATTPLQCEPVKPDTKTVSPVVEEAWQQLQQEQKAARKENELFTSHVTSKPPPRRKS